MKILFLLKEKEERRKGMLLIPRSRYVIAPQEGETRAAFPQGKRRGGENFTLGKKRKLLQFTFRGGERISFLLERRGGGLPYVDQQRASHLGRGEKKITPAWKEGRERKRPHRPPKFGEKQRRLD